MNAEQMQRLLAKIEQSGIIATIHFCYRAITEIGNELTQAEIKQREAYFRCQYRSLLFWYSALDFCLVYRDIAEDWF